MRILALSLSLLLAAPSLAQNCFDGNFGTRLGIDTVDTVYPMQPIGFAFAFGGSTYTDIHVNDHGFVELSNAGVPAPLTTGAVALYNPTTLNFSAGAPKIAPLYCDMELTGGGQCFIRSSPTECVVTWWNVRSYGIPSPRFSFQLVLSPGGLIRMIFGPGCTNNSTFGGVSDNGICGVSPAGGAVLPASFDLSAGGSSVDNSTYENWATANGFDMANNTLLLVPTNPGFSYTLLGAPANCAATLDYGTGCGGLGMTSVGLPSIGNAGFDLRISGIPTTSPIAFVGFGTVVVNPGIPLASIGMNGCTGSTNLDLGLFTSGAVVAGVSDFILPIPNNPAVVGTVLSSQGVSLSTTTALGLAASNGTQLTLGFGQ